MSKARVNVYPLSKILSVIVNAFPESNHVSVEAEFNHHNSAKRVGKTFQTTFQKGAGIAILMVINVTRRF